MILMLSQVGINQKGNYVGTIGIIRNYKPLSFTAELTYLTNRLLLDLSDYPIKFLNQKVLVYGKLLAFRKGNKVLFKLKVFHIEQSNIHSFIVDKIGLSNL
eukprot:NODE_20_length_44879_cov_0.624654.p36 type:complete len:101 gc:universal NODE_20_length_44879_cov_0.624654:10368-10670(+)